MLRAEFDHLIKKNKKKHNEHKKHYQILIY